MDFHMTLATARDPYNSKRFEMQTASEMFMREPYWTPSSSIGHETARQCTGISTGRQGLFHLVNKIVTIKTHAISAFEKLGSRNPITPLIVIQIV
jgi:hypothetical protein